MIKYKDTILENYSIDPVTAIITNSKGEIQKTSVNQGRPCFKGVGIHVWQMHTNFEAKNMDIHHLDGNKFNNSLKNLVYLTHSQHAKIHSETRKFSEETKKKMRKANIGENNPMYGKHHSEETKRKMRESSKGKNKDRIWINNGMINKFVKIEEGIPEGFVRGRLKWKK